MTDKNFFRKAADHIDENYAKKLLAAANAYFRECDSGNERIRDTDEGRSKNPVRLARAYTLSGLCGFLGISKRAFAALAGSPAAEETILYIKLRIEAFIEENMLCGRIPPSAAVLSLKQDFAWGEKSAYENVCDLDFTGYEEYMN